MKSWLRFALLSILLLSLTCGSVQGQRVLGVIWDLPAEESRAIQQLRQFRDLGISALELQQIPSRRVWYEINQGNFTVYGSLGILFPTAHTFAEADSTFGMRVGDAIRDFAAQPAVKALNLFTHGAVHQADFNRAAASFFSRFRTLREVKLYHTGRWAPAHAGLPARFYMHDIHLSPANTDSLTIPASSTLLGYRYRPPDVLKELVTPLQRVARGTSGHPQKPLFMEGNWLLSMVEKHPRLRKTLHSLSSDADPVFPIPSEAQPSQSTSPLPTLTLLLVWATLAFHYNTSPLYRKSLFRYFTGHTFFLNDIFRQHIRSPFPALVIIMQNALLTAAVAFTIVTNFWSELGLRSLIYHFPDLFLISGSEYDIFIAFFGFTLVFSLAGILWLYFPYTSIVSITQIMTVFAWPMQINIVLGSFVIAVQASGGHATITVFLAGLILLVCLWSFVIAALDASRSLPVKRLRYISVTAGLYLVVLTGLSVWLLEFSDPLWQALDLSLALK